MIDLVILGISIIIVLVVIWLVLTIIINAKTRQKNSAMLSAVKDQIADHIYDLKHNRSFVVFLICVILIALIIGQVYTILIAL